MGSEGGVGGVGGVGGDSPGSATRHASSPSIRAYTANPHAPGAAANVRASVSLS